MAQRVGWSWRALNDLEDLADYIGADSPTFAGIVMKKIVSQTRMLAEPDARFLNSMMKVSEN